MRKLGRDINITDSYVKHSRAGVFNSVKESNKFINRECSNAGSIGEHKL